MARRRPAADPSPSSPPASSIALDMRRAGCSYFEIAAELGLGEEAAQQLVSQALEAVDGPLLAIRLELSRLDASLRGISEQAFQGNPGAIEQLMANGKRRMELLDQAWRWQLELRLAELAGEPGAGPLGTDERPAIAGEAQQVVEPIAEDAGALPAAPIQKRTRKGPAAKARQPRQKPRPRRAARGQGPGQA